MTTSAPGSPAERLSTALADTRFGPVDWVDETGSTNADLLDAARSGAPDGQVLVADHQHAGRGRRGRSWEATPGDALLMSVLLRPQATGTDAATVGWLVSATSVALVDSLRVLGVAAAIKWPNDVVVPAEGGPAKLAGVLAESVVSSSEVDAVVVGVGCNVGARAAVGIDGATSVEDQVKVSVDRVELAAATLRRLDALLATGDPGRLSERIRRRYLECSATVGKTVRVELADGEVVGNAVDIDDGGRLLVDTATGIEVVTVGDVVHLRPFSPDRPH